MTRAALRESSQQPQSLGLISLHQNARLHIQEHFHLNTEHKGGDEGIFQTSLPVCLSAGTVGVNGNGMRPDPTGVLLVLYPYLI